MTQKELGIEELDRFIKTTIAGILDHPEDVEYEVIRGEQTIVYEIRVPKSEIGRAIGKNGKHARSIIILGVAIGAKHKYRTTINILEKPTAEKPSDVT